jgi:methionine-rich copper-binding protein CopC
MKRVLFISTVLVSMLAIDGSADAHAFLLKSAPVVGAAIPSPKTVRLEFSEGVELRFSGIEVDNAAGAPVKTAAVRYEGDNRKIMLVDLPPLASGTYRVKWHVVSLDTHRTEGDFNFTVKP